MFWGAVLSYCMCYRMLESAEVSSKPNILGEKKHSEYWAIILN